MIYPKAAKRIEQYLTFLDRKKYMMIGGSAPCDVDPIAVRWSASERSLESCRISSWFACVTDGRSRVPPGESEKWHPVTFPCLYGRDNETWWFAASITLGENIFGQELFLELDTQTDTLVYINGVPVGAVNPFHRKIRITPFFQDESKSLQVHLELWSGHRFPGYHPFDGPRVLTTVAVRTLEYPLRFKEPRVLGKIQELYDLYYDVLVLYRLAETLDEQSFLYGRIVGTLHRALLKIDMTAAVGELTSQASVVRKEIAPLLQIHNGSLSPQIYSVGNAHLDHAWLWPMSETKRKVARTCANMAAFTEEFPEFRFLFSQPAQMVDLAEEYPDIFSRVLQAFRRGQWEPNGVSWVEPDCSLSGGESLIRQFMTGRKTTERLFDGYSGDVFWAPDTFGFAASLPQILRGCGISYFVTSKLSWNDTNRFPYDLFLWEGIDGTIIPAHMIPTAYEGNNDPKEVLTAWNRVQHKDVQSALIRSIGEGDGGGGTLRSDLELLRRMADLQGLPKNRWSNLSDALKTIFSDCSELPIYVGELYLELHRGTLTSQAWIKQYNRRLERMLHDLEYLETLLALHRQVVASKADIDAYDQIARFRDAAWLNVLTNQFHDILPGSSVRMVNEEAIAAYGDAEKMVREAFDVAERLFDPDMDTEAGEVFWNTESYKKLSLVPAVGDDSTVQMMVDPNGDEVSVMLAEAEGLSAVCTGKRISGELKSPFAVDGNVIETPWHVITTDASGGFSSCILGQTGQELVPSGESMNGLMLAEDLPCNWDAWDIEADYVLKERRVTQILSREVVSCGPLFLQIRQRFAVGSRSTLEQDIFFYMHTARIDFVTRVHWMEEHKLLRVVFPTKIRSDIGLFDIPFGYVSRRTRMNDSTDRARFEVSAHKWAMIGDNGCAAAIISDSKYGYRIRNGVLSLSLLRAPTAPDPAADRGDHGFTYAFYPTTEGISSVIREASEVNAPLRRLKGSLWNLVSRPICRISTDEVAVETIKRAESNDGIVIRLRETLGAHTHCVLTCDRSLRGYRVELTDLLEQHGRPCPMDPASLQIPLSFGPFELKTLVFYKL